MGEELPLADPRTWTLTRCSASSLRRPADLTAHLEWLVGHLAPGPVREALVTWAGTRRLLP
ncbi:hypothetical protein ACIQMZ_37050 [Streptomyces longwoodensis]|uniref:hypothetical protein n=1 Tax=Streptomyces longwoodensis TaxID=68231 RepID=UPI00381BC1DB